MGLLKKIKRAVTKKVVAGSLIGTGLLSVVGGGLLIAFPPAGLSIAALGLSAVAVEKLIELGALVLVGGGLYAAGLGTGMAKEVHVGQKKVSEKTKKHQSETEVLVAERDKESQNAKAQTDLVKERTTELNTYKKQCADAKKNEQKVKETLLNVTTSVSEVRDELHSVCIDEEVLELDPEDEEAVNDSIHSQTSPIAKKLDSTISQLSQARFFQPANTTKEGGADHSENCANEIPTQHDQKGAK